MKILGYTSVFVLVCVLFHFYKYYTSFPYLLSNKNKNPSTFVKHTQISQNPKELYHLAKLYHEHSKGQSALHWYYKAYHGGCTYALLDIAHIYHWGLSDTPLNIKLAKELYQFIALNGTPSQRFDSQDKLTLISDTELNTLYPPIEPIVPIPIVVPIVRTQELQDNTDNIDPNIYNDPQNVHDTVVNNTIKKSVLNLQQHTPLVI